MNTVEKKRTKRLVNPTAYQMIMRKFNTSMGYISAIRTGERNPIKGKGLLIKQELERIFGEL